MSNIKVFENVSVRKAIMIQVIPAIVSMIFILIYNIADTFFIGQTGDALQVAAVSLATPVYLLFMAIGTLYGIGGTSAISRALGRGESVYAKSVSAFCYWASLFTGIGFIVFFYSCMEFILSWIGVSSQTADFTRLYLETIAWGAPFVLISNSFSNILRAEGKSGKAMLGMIIGTIINIILDPLFILTWDKGIEGAVWANVIGNFISTVYYWFLLTGKTTRLSIAWKDLRISLHLIKEIFSIGFPAALNCILMSVSNIVLNLFLIDYGDIPVAAMGIAMKVCMIVVLLQIGLGQGVQPLLGYCYGARNKKRFQEIIRYTNHLGLIMGIVLTVICYCFAGTIVLASSIRKAYSTMESGLFRYF